MNAVVVCIDGFDHGVGGYQNPAPIAPGVSVRRAEPALTYNYGGDRPKHVDIRVTVHDETKSGEAKSNQRKLKAFDSGDFEE